MSSSKLFQPIQLGEMNLSHRVVMAPLTRFRGTDDHVPGPLAVEYYSQRASTPGTFLTTEATFIAARAGGYAYVPGIWSKDQINGWKKVTEAVHAKKSFIYLQLWALGRQANPAQLAKEGLADSYNSSSSIPLAQYQDVPPPRQLTVDEVHEYVQLYATAAANAIEAGFDGVEIHGANGYLIDQFLQDVCNKRTDEYGGSVENRVRFAQEVVDAVVAKIGVKRTGFRVSPWGRFGDVRMQDPTVTYSHLISTLLTAHPQLAYIHVVEPRVDGASTRTDIVPDNESNDFIRDIVRQKSDVTKVISAGAYTRESGIATAEAKGDLIAYGRLFISNPDLPYRLLKDIRLTLGNRDTYYAPGNITGLGYTDYPFADEQTGKL